MPQTAISPRRIPLLRLPTPLSPSRRSTASSCCSTHPSAEPPSHSSHRVSLPSAPSHRSSCPPPLTTASPSSYSYSVQSPSFHCHPPSRHLLPPRFPCSFHVHANISYSNNRTTPGNSYGFPRRRLEKHPTGCSDIVVHRIRKYTRRALSVVVAFGRTELLPSSSPIRSRRLASVAGLQPL